MRVQSITPQEAASAVLKGEAILVDVREDYELQDTGTAQPALWMPLSEVESQGDEFKKFIALLSSDKKIIVYCAAGMRSEMFAGFLIQKGFQAFNMGGFDDWVSAGHPVRQI